MARASYSATPLLHSLVHRPQGVILVRELHRSRAKVNLEPRGEDRDRKVDLQKALFNKSAGEKTD